MATEPSGTTGGGDRRMTRRQAAKAAAAPNGHHEAEAAPVAPPASRVIDINGKAADLSRALPLTVGDFKRLAKDGLDVARLRLDQVGIDQLSRLALAVCAKANPAITMDDIDELALSRLNELALAATTTGTASGNAGGGGDRPLSKPPTD